MKNLFDEVLYMKKESYKTDSLQILTSDKNVNTLMFDNFHDECLIDFTLSSGIVIDDTLKMVVLGDTDVEGILITNEISSPIKQGSIANLYSKIYRYLPLGSNIEAFIMLGEEEEYPINFVTNAPLNYLNVENLNIFRFKLVITRSDVDIKPSIESIAIFYKDSVVL